MVIEHFGSLIRAHQEILEPIGRPFFRCVLTAVVGATVENFVAQIIVPSADIANAPDLFARDNTSSVGVGCAMIYADATTNNSCDNPLLLYL
ncbi:hypothetical protein TNCV_1720951 [Trichonephila clavipes]|nr:hypothetical protein TNCV_1720951 [Trichonephila clavipes]